jgi:hypothetical protein
MLANKLTLQALWRGSAVNSVAVDFRPSWEVIIITLHYDKN